VRSKTLADLLAAPREEEQYLIGSDLLPKGGLMAIYGRAGTLKSWLSIDMAFHICEGEDWLGHPTERTSVLIVQTEQPEPLYTERLVKYVSVGYRNGRVPPDNLYFDNDLTLKLDTFNGQQVLFQNIKDRQPGLVILDCLYQMIENVSNQVALNRFKDNIDKARQTYGTSFLLIHHPRKQSRDREDELGFEEMAGMASLEAWLDTIIRLTGDPPNGDQPLNIILSYQKVKNARREMRPISLGFDRETARFHFL